MRELSLLGGVAKQRKEGVVRQTGEGIVLLVEQQVSRQACDACPAVASTRTSRVWQPRHKVRLMILVPPGSLWYTFDEPYGGISNAVPGMLSVSDN
jgi:hypothetical protein